MTPPVLGPQLTALVADGSAYGARIVRGVLGRTGLRKVVEALDGAEALSALEDHKPDLLILDWQLPVIPARDIVEMVRNETPSMPVVVLMAEPTESAVSGALALKVDAIVARPFSPKEFRLRVERIVRERLG